jgi:hypothetical protein
LSGQARPFFVEGPAGGAAPLGHELQVRARVVGATQAQNRRGVTIEKAIGS